MKKSRFGNSRFSGVLRRNGVYIALTIGLAAICAVGLYGAHLSQTDTTEPVEERPVEQPVTNQPDDRTTTTVITQESTTTTTEEVVETLYVFPLTNLVQKPFSGETPAYSETMKDWRLHLGVDFEGESGQTVKATAKGTVKSVTEDAMWGTIVTIDHGVGVVTRYCGIEPSVEEGDEVDASTPIGTLSEIPCESAQAPHLHMEMTVDGTPIDPVTAIGLEVRYGDNSEE